MERVEITFERLNADEGVFKLRAADESVTDHKAVFTVVRKVKVHQSRGLTEVERLYQKPVEWDGLQSQIPVPLTRMQMYSYDGEYVDVEIATQVWVDDSLLVDTRIRRMLEVPLATRPRLEADLGQLIAPDDLHSYIGNFEVLSPGEKTVVVMLALATVFMMLIGLLSFAFFENAIILYLFIVVSVCLVLGIATYTRTRMRSYLEGLEVSSPRVRRGEAVRLDLLLDARAAIDIDAITVRVVALNYECGRYRRGSGKQERFGSFRQAVRGVVLFERTYTNIAAGDSLASHMRGDVMYFDPLYEYLYPPNLVAGSGVDMSWEVQIFHDTFLDHDAQGSNEIFSYRDFVVAPDAD